MWKSVFVIESKRSRNNENYSQYVLQIYRVSLEEYAGKIDNSYCL